MDGAALTERDETEVFETIYARIAPEIETLIGLYPQKRSALIPMMHRFQEEQGYLCAAAMQKGADLCGITLAAVESTVSFYTLLFRRPVGKYMLQPCRNLSCRIGGADEIMAYFREQLGLDHLETSDDGIFSYEEVECLAACDRAPCMQINLEFVYDLTREKINEMIAQMKTGAYPVKPLVQTKRPAKTWSVPKDTVPKSPGGRGVPDPNDPGGIGDPSGIIVLDRFAKDEPAYAARSKERLVRDSVAAAALDDPEHHSGPNGKHH